MCLFIPLCVCDGSSRPDVEFEESCVSFEELGKFVLGGEDGPLGWELHVWHVVIPDWVVENKLMVSLAPVVSYSFILIDGESVDAEHFESCGSSQASLASTY